MCLSSVRRRQVLEIYQVTSLLRLCIPGNHSDYPPVSMASLEIIPYFRQRDVIILATNKKLTPKYASTIRQTWQDLLCQENASP